MKQKRLFIIISLIVLVIGLAAGAYFFLKASDDTKEWRNAAGQLHRENDQPAVIEYSQAGEIAFEEWWQNDQRHRENDRPARIEYDENGEIRFEEWWQNDQRYRENDLPALIEYSQNGEIASEEWYLNGKFIRSEPPE